MDWLKCVLSTLNCNHKYFYKSYYPSDAELGIKVKKYENNEINVQTNLLL